jgi:hypothetical protein
MIQLDMLQVFISMFCCATMGCKDYWTDPGKFNPDKLKKAMPWSGGSLSHEYLLENQICKKFFGGGVGNRPGRNRSKMFISINLR